MWRIDRDIDGIFTASQTLFRYHTPIENLSFTMDNDGNIVPAECKPKVSKEEEKLSKEDWDSRETSWDFSKNELLKHKSDSKFVIAYNNYCSYWKEKFYKLHSNEEVLNRLFIDIYELQDEITPDVDLKDITISKQESFINDSGELEFDSSEIIKQFISYAVGVMFGRYSLDHDGLHIANQNESIEEANEKFNIQKSTFKIDEDNVIPILDGEWFIDDISERFFQFAKVTFGNESYEKNLDFIANLS